MAILEEKVLRDSIEINTTAEKIFKFLTGLVDDESYRAWHKQDHVTMRWLKGQPWAEGSVVYAEEYIHGKLHKLKFAVTKVVPNERIEYAPTSRLLRKYFPKNVFAIEQKGQSCLFTASSTYRVGRLAKTFFKKALENGLSSVKQHMKEEGENLKTILENRTV
ncbi:SRPBCC family protein [Planctomycetota bacterium]